MKQLLIFISLFLAIVCNINAQSIAANQFNGRLQMTAVSNVSDSIWSITGYFTNSVNKHTTTQIAVNDKFFCQIGANTYVGRISVINSASDVTKLITFRVICNYPNPPNNIGAIVRLTSNNYPVYVDGIPNALQAGIQNYLVTLINTQTVTSGLTTILTNSNNAGGIKITNLGTPTVNSDATTKLYVDAQRDTSINRATRALRDTSKYLKTLFRRDTTIAIEAGETVVPHLDFEPIAQQYNNVHYMLKSTPTDTGEIVFFLPYDADYFRGVTFYAYAENVGLVRGLNNAAHFMNRKNYLVLNKGQSALIRSLPDSLDGLYRWYITRIIDTIPTPANPTITLTGPVTGTGTTSIATAITDNSVTTTKILDANVTLNKLASNSVNSAKIVDASVSLTDMATNSVNGSKIVDYSINGDDIGYSILRAGDASNAILRFANGSVLTTPVNGAWEWDSNKLNFTIGGVRKRFGMFTDAAPTGGQLMIGNGVDFTLANLTNGYAQTITNGSGTISITPDTTKVIPFIPNAEISNGTRNGYFWNRTSGIFGHQFYRNGFRVFNNSAISTGASTGMSITHIASGNYIQIQPTITSSNVPYLDIAASGSERGDKTVRFEEKGTTIPMLYNSISANNQAVATYQIDGENSIEYITNATPTDVTLPEITATPTAANQVGVGAIIYICVNASTGKNINGSGSDVIIRHGSSATVTTVTTTGGTYYLKKFVALELNTWGEF